jgi:hypothetical protein
VALLILKSAVELAIETICSLDEEEVDLSRHEFWFTDQYEQFRQAQMRDWMLYLVEKQGANACRSSIPPKVCTYLPSRSLYTP